MEYVLGALAGLAYGAVAGLIKYRLLWKKMMSSKNEEEVKASGMVVRMAISFAVDIALLFVVFFFRHEMPFNYYAAIIGAAVGLSVTGKALPSKAIKDNKN